MNNGCKDDIKLFLISTSLPIVWFTYYFFLISNNFKHNALFLIIPLLYGVFGVLNHKIIKKYNKDYSLLVGLVFGIIVALICENIFNFPLPLHMVLYYSLQFRFVLTPIIEYIL